MLTRPSISLAFQDARVPGEVRQGGLADGSRKVKRLQSTDTCGEDEGVPCSQTPGMSDLEGKTEDWPGGVGSFPK